MKCKRHPYEVGPGVCASCLRERLLEVIAAQIALEKPSRRRPDPILIPASISPHRRSADSAAARHHPLFFSTPQVTPSSASAAARSRSFLSSVFAHHRSEEPDPDPDDSKRSGSNSWFASLIPRRRRKKKMNTNSIPPPEAAPPPPPRRACRDRGMSPAAEEEDGATDLDSGYSTETSGMSRRTMPTPMRGNHHQHPHHSHHRQGGFSGFVTCLSPMMRPTPPARRCHTAAAAAAELGFSGDLHAGPGCTRRGCDSFGPNRSRKVADFGRFR